MKTPSYLSAICLVVAVTASLSLLQRSQPAPALPTFAQAYQVDCSVCHTMVPALNAYGRYVQSTAFAALDAKILRRAVPLVVRESINYQSTGKSRSEARDTDRATWLNGGLFTVALAYIRCVRSPICHATRRACAAILPCVEGETAPPNT